MCVEVSSHNLLPSKVMTLTVASDEASVLYVDGIYVAETKVYSPVSLEISTTSRLIAVQVVNRILFIAFIAVTSTKIGTDTTWRCTTSVVGNDWMKLKYDDSLWPQAVLFASNRNGYTLMPSMPIFPADSYWISVDNNKSPEMFCRKLL